MGSSGPGPAKPVNPAIAAMRKEKKPVSPFLRAKTCPVELAGGSGSNKHIRFNEDGSVQENGVEDKVKEEAETNGKDSEKVKSESEESKTEVKPDVEENPKTPVSPICQPRGSGSPGMRQCCKHRQWSFSVNP